MSEQDAGEVLANVITRLEKIERRLDKQADAIKKLQRGDHPAGTGVQRVAPATGEYVHSLLCVICDAPKGTRRTLTCRECGARRAKQIKGTEPRTEYNECLNCREPKGGGMKMLCDPCSASFKQWKAGM